LIFKSFIEENLISNGYLDQEDQKKSKKSDLFIELASPDSKGISRWVSVREFVGKYSELTLLNGLSWGRRLAKRYIIELDREETTGKRIDRIRLNGFNTPNVNNISQYIKKEIRERLRCVVLGVNSTGHRKVEIDHKDGRKNDPLVMCSKTQKETDFQPLSNAANVAKRQHCKRCKETDIRFDAMQIGYTSSHILGDSEYTEEIGCNGCYWFDPIEFRQHFILNSKTGINNN